MNKTFNVGNMIRYCALIYEPNRNRYLMAATKESMVVCPGSNDDEYLLDNGLILSAPMRICTMQFTTAYLGIMRKTLLDSASFPGGYGKPDYGCAEGFARFLISAV